MENKPAILFFFFAVLLMTPLSVYATPIISSAPATVGDSQGIVISGNGFGTKNPAKPYLWAPFDESLNPSDLGVKTSWNHNENMTYAAGEGVTGGGAKGIVGTYGYGPPWALEIDSDGFNWNDLGLKMYVYRKTKENFSTAGINWKIIRAWHAGTTSPDFYIHPNMASGAEGVAPQTSNWFLDPSTARGSANVWRTEEFIQQANSATNLSDGFVQWVTDATPTFYVPSSYDPGDIWKINDGSGSITELYPVHGVEANSWDDFEGTSRAYWADDVYVDNTWSRVMICSGSTWSSRGNCEIQIPSAWSDTSATVTINQGAFPDSSSQYLYVVDADGNANSSGYPITFGSGTSDTTAPASPSGLGVM